MPQLERLGGQHADAVLAFEVENREYFASSISDRGDEYFEGFSEGFCDLLAAQDAGSCACFVVLDERGAVEGRFNLYDLEHGSADVGYRVAQHAAGRGLATSALSELCSLAAEALGLTTLNATASDGNVASRRVLEKAGFVAVGPTVVAGRDATRYARMLDGRSGA